MALLEDALGGWTGGALLGIGAAVVAPSIIPAAGSILRPVAKAALALGAAYLDGIFHRSDPISRSGSVPARVVTGTYPSMFNGRFAVCNAAVLPGKSPCRNPVAGV